MTVLQEIGLKALMWDLSSAFLHLTVLYFAWKYLETLKEGGE